MDGYLKRDDGLLAQPDRSRLDVRRVVAAFFLAPLAGAVALATFDAVSDGTFGGERFREGIGVYSFGALPTALVLGVPAYLILKKLFRATLLACTSVGAVIAAFPWFILGLIPQPGFNAWTNGEPTIVDGNMTALGWLQFAEFLLTISAAGAIGGSIFWLIAAKGTPQTRTR